MEPNNKKLTILNIIRENKKVLFGKFSTQLTAERKVDKWKDITEQLQAIGIFTKDWKYLKNSTWKYWKKRSLEKMHNQCKPRSRKGKLVKFDEYDQLVYDILTDDPGDEKSSELSDSTSALVDNKFNDGMDQSLKVENCPRNEDVLMQLDMDMERYKLELEMLKEHSQQSTYSSTEFLKITSVESLSQCDSSYEECSGKSNHYSEDTENMNYSDADDQIQIDQEQCTDLGVGNLHYSHQEIDIISQSWAIQFQKASPNQQLLAKRAIDDILFEACMGRLEENQDQFKQEEY